MLKPKKPVQNRKTRKVEPESRELIQQKMAGGLVLTNNEVGVVNREKVAELCSEYILEHHKLPSATHIAKELGMTIKTASKHLNSIYADTASLKLMARKFNGKVVAKHFETIMSEEKVSAPLLGLWYDHFGIGEEEDKKKSDTGKVTVNIVVSQPKNYTATVQEAEIIQEDSK